jgi:hypothetical protein
MQHLRPAVRRKALRELHRCLKPGGTLRIVDMDGAFFNIHPLGTWAKKALHKLFDGAAVDMYVGRKLPTELRVAGFAEIDWDIQVIDFKGELMKTEIRLNTERFEQMQAYLASVLGGSASARRITREFLVALGSRDAVFYYNKFSISAIRGGKPTLVKG